MDTHAFSDPGGLSAEELELLAYLLEDEGVELAERQTIFPREQQDQLPLSFAQSRLWFLNQLDPEITDYNSPFAIRLTGRLDVEALRRSLDAIVARHEALRTTFPAIDGQPIQQIAPALALALPLIDLQALSPADREAEIRHLATREARQHFDLARGPLAVAKLLCLQPDEHVLLLTFHHIIFDGWSIDVFQREITALYDAFSRGIDPQLPPLTIQYADFALWQRAWLAPDAPGSVLAQQRAYWRRQLSRGRDGRPGPPVLHLPTDRPRPPRQTHRGAHYMYSLPPALLPRLTTLSQREGATLFMTLLAAFNVLLHRYSRQDDIVVGTPIANRDFVELEQLIGFFVNTLLIRTDLSGNPSFRELLGRVRETTLEAYAHQNIPFEQVADELQPERNLSHNPLFQVMFALQNAPKSSYQREDLQMSFVPIESGTARFDLLLALVETETSLNAVLEYNTDLFAAATAERLLTHYQVLLAAIAADPDQPIATLPLLPAAERQQLLVEWNPTSDTGPRDRCIHELIAAQATRTPDAVAVVCEEQTLSYADLDARANQLAHYLQRQGIGPDTLVGVCLERSLDLIVAILGVLKAGGAYVPLDPTYPAERLQFMLDDARPAVLLTQQHLAPLLPTQSNIQHPTSNIISIDAGWPAIAREPSSPPPSRVTPDHLAYVIYTSGSLGQPKGVLIPHRNLVNAYLAWEQAYGLRSDVRVHLQMASFSFDVFAGDLVRALCSGGTLVLCPRELLLTPEELYALIRRRQVDCAEFVPVVLRSLADYLEQSGQRLDCMRLLVCGSDTWYVQEYRRFQPLCGPQTRLINSFGLTEATIDSTYFESTTLDLAGDQIVPIGRPFTNTRLYILDHHGQLAPTGVPGELHIGGAGLARGYLNRASLTAEKFVPDPFGHADFGLGIADFGLKTDDSPIQNLKSPIQNGLRLYKTGDLARYRADGQIEFLGRADHQVKIRGFRVEPGEIEAVLARHPSIREITVLARPAAPGDLRLVAYVVPRDDDPLTRDVDPDTRHTTLGVELRRWGLERLPDYMIPAALVLLDALPLTPTGKIDRQALPAPDWSSRPVDATFVAPRTPLEETIAGLTAQVLGVERVGIHDNFFALGGHSLLATQLVARLREAFAIDLALRSLFEDATVAGLAQRVETIQWMKQSERVPAGEQADDYEEGAI